MNSYYVLVMYNSLVRKDKGAIMHLPHREPSSLGPC